MARPEPYADIDDLDRRLDGWLAQVRRTAAPRPHLVLDPRRCALLVIDLQRYFVSPGGGRFLPAAPAVVPRVVALLEAWRSLGAPVVFTRHGHTGEADLGMFGRFFSRHLRADAPDATLADGLDPRPGERVLRKATYDAFLHTGLETHLREVGAEQVLVTGVQTHLCCDTTARAAFCRGFEVHAAADAMASSTEALHVGALCALADGVAVVSSVDEVLARCR